MAVTAPRWHEEAQSNVGNEVKIWRSCEGVLDGRFGYLLISKQRAKFVHEKGLSSKAVKNDLNLPYNQVGKIIHSDDRVFDIAEESSEHHTFQTDIIGVSRIEELLREHLEQMLREDEFDSP